MTAEEIAQEMWNITADFQKQTGISDGVVDEVIKHCFRKMQLTNQPAEYILLLLPDELKDYCFRCMINARGIELMNRKEAVRNV